MITEFDKQGDTFPELTKRTAEIKDILDEEEESFSRTLDRGEKMFDQYANRARQQGTNQLSGKDVWRLYDTYGFPVDLTRLMAEELHLEFSDIEFEEAQAQSKEASKVLKRDVAEVIKLDVHDIAVLEKNDLVPKTDDSAKFCESTSAFTRDIAIYCLQCLGMQLPRSLHCITIKDSWIPLSAYLRMGRSESFLTKQVFTRRLEAKNMTQEA